MQNITFVTDNDEIHILNKKEAVNTLFIKLKKSEESAAKEGWIDDEELEKMIGD